MTAAFLLCHKWTSVCSCRYMHGRTGGGVARKQQRDGAGVGEQRRQVQRCQTTRPARRPVPCVLLLLPPL